jgi:hypothetical protein
LGDYGYTYRESDGEVVVFVFVAASIKYSASLLEHANKIHLMENIKACVQRTQDSFINELIRLLKFHL